MYKVFVYDKPVIFSCEEVFISNATKSLVVEVESRRKMKENFRRFVDSSNFESLVFICKQDAGKYFEDFMSLFWYLEAAGGIVRNQNSERLFIFRFGKWDLPKGKIEKGESTQQAALREVTEETGLTKPVIVKELPSTYHIYDHKGKMVFKKTYWYTMKYDGDEIPIPQIEEEITETIWLRPEEIEIIYSNTYPSLIDLIVADLQFLYP